MKIKENIPNLLTSLNLVCGFIAILLAFQPAWLMYSPFFIFLSLVFDFADGFFARMLKAFTEFGKQMDSLSDLVSFGVAPGVLIYNLLQFKLLDEVSGSKFLLIFLFALPALIPVFSALRLAKFNLDERQSSSFIGLPTPASAIFIASLILIYYAKTEWITGIILSDNNFSLIKEIILNKFTIILIVLLDSFLMVSEIPMFAFKFKSLAFKDFGVQYIFIGIAIVTIIIFKLVALPLLICLYVITSIINNMIKRKKNIVV